jgi:YfiH family protein
VTEEDKGKGALLYEDAISGTDALITDRKNIPLTVFTADCLSIFLYDPLTPAIGLVHAGWRSTKEGIASKAVRLMKEKFNTDLSRLVAAFGPNIQNCCYGVGEEFKDYFGVYVREEGGKYYFDLSGFNRKQLWAAGVNEANIFDYGVCTCCNYNEFFSYRREKEYCGRMISVIMLK